MLADPPRKMPVLILAEPFPAPQSSTFIPALAVLHAFRQCNQHWVSLSPGSSGFYGSPWNTQGAKSCLQRDCLLWETQGKARVWGLCPLTKHEYHSKSKSKQQGHCSLFFLPISSWEAMSNPGISGREGGVTFLLQTESWEQGLMQLLPLKEKPKSPSLF